MKNYHPSLKGYKKLNIKHKDIHSVFTMRKLYWTKQFSLWYNPLGCKYLLIEDMTLFAKIIHTLALPFIIILSIINYKEIILDWLDIFNRLERGKYSSDTIYPPNPIKNRRNNEEFWLKLRNIHI